MIRRHRAGAAWLLSVALTATVACGTRLPDSRFETSVAGSSSGASNGANGNVGAGSQGGTGASAGGGGSTSGGGASAAGGGSTASGGSVGGSGGSGGSGGATTGAGGSGGSGASGGGATSGGGGGGSSSSGPNTASDVGVTATSIKIGNITGLNGPLGPDAFGPTLHGLQSLVASVNARGGVNGRKIILDSCDDGQDGAANLTCAQKLIGQDKIFAFIANNSLTTSSSASYEYQQGVPDLGLPLNNGYYKYPNMFSLYGTQYPRDGKQTGDHGLNWNNTAVYRYFKRVTGVTKAAFFFYSEASSSSAAKSDEQQATAEGIQVAYESGGSQGENLAAPNFDADVLAMKSKGVDGMFDAVDANGNQKICASMDRYGVTVKAKVSTIEVWSQDVGSSAWSAPCRDSIYVGSVSVPYSDTSNPSVAQFRSDFNTYSPGSLLHQWALEGYGAGWILVDALTAMGGSPTRKGFINWLDALPFPETYTDHGLFAPVSWKNEPHPIAKSNCDSFAQWQDSAGTFVNKAGPTGFACSVTSEISSPYTDDGS